MLKKIKFSSFFVFVFLSSSVLCASLEQTITISAASGALCIHYAEEVGGDIEAFSELNVAVMQAAEKMGYTNDLQLYLSVIHRLKIAMHDQLMQEHGTKLNIYNDWCIRLYDGFVNGLNRVGGGFSD